MPEVFVPQIMETVGDPPSSNRPQDVALVQAMFRAVRDANGQPFLQGSVTSIWDPPSRRALYAFQIAVDTALPPGMGMHQPTRPLLATPVPATAVPGLDLPGMPPIGGWARSPTCPDSYPDTFGYLVPDSATWDKLVERLPRAPHDYTRLAVLPNIATVALKNAVPPNSFVVYFKADRDNDLKASTDEIRDQPLNPDFKKKVRAVVDRMYEDYQIVLRGWTTLERYSSYRRSFNGQLTVYKEKHSKAGPGEGDHNWGQAMDIGFKGLKWVHTDGTVHVVRVQEDKHHPLEDWEHRTATMKQVLLTARNQIVQEKGLFTITAWNGWDPFHIQAFKEGTCNMARSLVAQLRRVNSGMRWKVGPAGVPRPSPPDGDVSKGRHYLCDLGLDTLPDNHFVDIGTSPQIWDKQVQLTKPQIAAARSAATHTAVTVADVSDQDLKDLKDQILTVFKQADLGWESWQPVP
jgi:hypothetical protein